jgi:Tfp pilus assembly protein PilN
MYYPCRGILFLDTLRLSPRAEQNIKQLSVTALGHYQQSLEQKAEFLGSVTNGRIVLTEKLDQIPVILPKDSWITSLKYEEEMTRPSEEEYPELRSRRIRIEGVIVGNSRSREIERINDLIKDIRKNTRLFKGMTDANIRSTKVVEFPGAEATKFEIELTGK